MRLQEKILAQRDDNTQSDSDESEEEPEGISDDKLLSIYAEHKETGRAGTTPWKTIMSELQKFTNEKVTVHKLKQRVKQLGEPISSKHTPTPKTPTKSKRSTVVELDDDDDDDDDDDNNNDDDDDNNDDNDDDDDDDNLTVL